jgi:hypothetical protein
MAGSGRHLNDYGDASPRQQDAFALNVTPVAPGSTMDLACNMYNDAAARACDRGKPADISITR